MSRFARVTLVAAGIVPTCVQAGSSIVAGGAAPVAAASTLPLQPGVGVRTSSCRATTPGLASIARPTPAFARLPLR